MSWVAEGVSASSRWGHPSPVVHLVVVDREELWCSGGRARVAAIHHQAVPGYKPPRICKRCAALAAEAIGEDMLDARDAGRFTEA